MRRFTHVLAILVSLAGVSPAGEWQLDKAHSEIRFAVTHMMIAEVSGKFRDFTITFASSNPDFTDATIEAVIEAASIDTEQERRDNHLRAGDFFDVQQFPQIRFESTSIERIDDRKYKIKGNLTIKGVTKEVVFDAVHRGILQMGGEKRTAWKVTAEINRYDFGLRWNKALETGGVLVGEIVEVTLNLQFTQRSA